MVDCFVGGFDYMGDVFLVEFEVEFYVLIVWMFEFVGEVVE